MKLHSQRRSKEVATATTLWTKFFEIVLEVGHEFVMLELIDHTLTY